MNNYDVNSEIVGFNDDDDSNVSDSQCDSDIEFDLQIISSFIHFIVNKFWKTFNVLLFGTNVEYLHKIRNGITAKLNIFFFY